MAAVSEAAMARSVMGTPEAEDVRPRSFMEHRWGKRYAADLPVNFALPSGERGVGRLLNISITGAYLQTEMPLRILNFIDLFIDGVPPRDPRFSACVVRRDQGGVGLEWEAPIRPNFLAIALLVWNG